MKSLKLVSMIALDFNPLLHDFVTYWIKPYTVVEYVCIGEKRYLYHMHKVQESGSMKIFDMIWLDKILPFLLSIRLVTKPVSRSVGLLTMY